MKINASAELSLALIARPKINADARYFDLNNRKTERITKNVGIISICVLNITNCNPSEVFCVGDNPKKDIFLSYYDIKTFII